MDEIIKFLEATVKALENTNKATFKCPICNGEAEAVRVEYNGHKHSKCKKCGIRIDE